MNQLDNRALYEKAILFANTAHTGVNQTYGKYPYSYHLDMVDTIANIFSHLIPPEKFYVVKAGIRLHDTIEDCRLTYNDIKKEFNAEIADLVYAVTNEKGKNRDERANSKYYQGIKNVKFAKFIKLCDRIANIEASKIQDYLNGDLGVDTMFCKYHREMPTFKEHLYDINDGYHEMWGVMELLFEPLKYGWREDRYYQFYLSDGSHEGRFLSCGEDHNLIQLLYFKNRQYHLHLVSPGLVKYWD